VSQLDRRIKPVGMPALHCVVASSRLAGALGASRVEHLFASGGPSNVSRFVVSVVVDAIKRQFGRWTLANVCKKSLETVSPFLTDLNASAAVVAVLGVLGVVAPLIDGFPQRVLRAGAHAVCSGSVTDTASAGRGHADPQASDKNLSLCAALTPTEQITKFAVSRWGFVKNGPLRNDCAGCDTS
jgi:hypothetical protein